MLTVPHRTNVSCYEPFTRKAPDLDCYFDTTKAKEERRLRVFENKVLRIFGPNRDEVTEELRKLHKNKLHGPYSSPSIVRVIKWRRMRWTGHVARIGEMRVQVFGGET